METPLCIRKDPEEMMDPVSLEELMKPHHKSAELLWFDSKRRHRDSSLNTIDVCTHCMDTPSLEQEVWPQR